VKCDQGTRQGKDSRNDSCRGFAVASGRLRWHAGEVDLESEPFRGSILRPHSDIPSIGEVHLLTCPCGGKLTLIAAITEPEVIVKIHDHLGLPSEPLQAQ